MSSLKQKIAKAKKELNRDKKGKFNKKRDIFLLWGQYPTGWSMIKDMILCFVLFNILIGQLQTIDYSQIFAPRTLVIVNEVQAAEKVVQTPHIEVKSQHSAELGQMGEFTAYSKGVGFTPGSIMANGKEVSEGMAACPIKYSLGTKFEVEGKVYECADRMAKRFRDGNFFDLYKNDISAAKSFGRKNLQFKILK